MRSKVSKLALCSLGLGGAAILFALTRAGLFPLVALPFGLAAVACGVAAVWGISRSHAAFRGKGLAISGVLLGASATVVSLLVLAQLVLGQVFQGHGQQRNDHGEARMPRLPALSSISNEPVTDFTSNLPIILLETGGQRISKEESTLVRAAFFDVKNRRASAGAEPDHDGLARINLRGSSTLRLPKRSFTLHLMENPTNQTKVSLLGLPSEEDWVLYAPFEDKTLMRDVLAYELARKMGHYAPRTRYVELFIKNSDRPLSLRDYAGVYVLIEKIKRGKDRVNIAKLEPEHRSEPEITGGYIIKRDHSDRNETRFHTGQGGPYFYVYPKAEQITSQQKSWLTRYLNSFETALHGEAFTDPRTGYAAYLDVDSFIDAHWLIELSKNVDGFRYSAFLTKDRGGKLKPTPPWDWNRAFGNANYYGGGQVNGWYWSNLRPNEISWYLRLREDPAFVQRSAARWQELRKDVFDPKKINARIDQLAAELEEAQQRNFQRWPILGHPVTSNYYVGESFAEEVRWLKNWIDRRIAWMDSKINN